MSFHFKDLKPEYLAMEKTLREKYIDNYPESDEKSQDAYVKKQILRRARKLYDYYELVDLAHNGLDLNSIIINHKSVAERDNAEHYYECLKDYLLCSRRVADIGCGLNPALVLNTFPSIENYLCIDKDNRILEVLNIINCRFFYGKLAIFNSDFQEKPVMIKETQLDFVFIQKLIPRLTAESKRKILDNIASVDSKYFLITGNRFSLSRNISIEKEETKCLDNFIERYGFCKEEKFDKSNEFGWVVEKK